MHRAELKHEVLGKTVPVSPYGFIEPPGLDLIQAAQVRIEHDRVAADQKDAVSIRGVKLPSVWVLGIFSRFLGSNDSLELVCEHLR